jgi:hypothetical protein
MPNFKPQISQMTQMLRKKTENRIQESEFRAIRVEENYFESQAFSFSSSNHSMGTTNAGRFYLPPETAQF